MQYPTIIFTTNPMFRSAFEKLYLEAFEPDLEFNQWAIDNILLDEYAKWPDHGVASATEDVKKSERSRPKRQTMRKNSIS